MSPDGAVSCGGTRGARGLSSRGITRERQVRRLLEGEDWWVCRAAGSLGDADLVALRLGSRTRLVEVKSTAAGPYHSFGPKDRRDLILAANIAGADAWLCWWPPRGKPQWIPSWEWPIIKAGPVGYRAPHELHETTG
jgi:Holliday junction resolvase